MSAKNFDYEGFTKNIVEQVKDLIPKNFNESQKQYVEETVYKYTYTAGEFLSESDISNSLTVSQASTAAGVLAQTIFHKVCELISTATPKENWDKTLQNVAFVSFEVIKNGILKDLSADELFAQIEEAIKNPEQYTNFSDYEIEDCYMTVEEALKELENLTQKIKDEPDNTGLYHKKTEILQYLATKQPEDYTKYSENILQMYEKLIELEPAEKFNYLIVMANILVSLHKNDKAIEIATTLLEETEDIDEKISLLSFRADCYEDIQNYEAALADCDEILNIQETALFLATRAKYLQFLNKFDNAIEDLQKAIELDANNPYLFEEMAKCCTAKGDNNSALINYEKILQNNPSDIVIGCAAECCEKLGKLDKAIGLYDRAINDKPFDLDLQAERGVLYFKDGQYEKFLKDFENILAKEPAHSCAQIFFDTKTLSIKYVLTDIIESLKTNTAHPQLLAFFLKEYSAINYHIENYKKSLQYCDEALELQKDYESAYTQKVLTLIELKETQKAKDVSDERYLFILNNPEKLTLKEKFESFCSRVQYLHAVGDKDSAILLFSKTVQEFEVEESIIYLSISNLINKFKKSDKDFALILESIFKDKLKPESILTDLNQKIEENPKDAGIYARRADFYSSYDGNYNYSAAIKDYTRAIELKPDNSDYYAHRSSCYKLLDKYNEALEDINKAIELGPDNIDYYEKRGEIYYCYQEASLKQKAIADYKKVLESPKKCSLAASYQYLIAEIYEYLKDYENALIYYEQSANNDNFQKLSAYSSAAKCCHKAKQYSKACDYCEKALKTATDTNMLILVEEELFKILQEIAQQSPELKARTSELLNKYETTD